MKKLLFILLLLPTWCMAQTSVTPQWKKNANTDSLGAVYPPSPTINWFYSSPYLRGAFIRNSSVLQTANFNITGFGSSISGFKIGDSSSTTDRHLSVFRKVSTNTYQTRFGASVFGGLFMSSILNGDTVGAKGIRYLNSNNYPESFEDGGLTGHPLASIETCTGCTFDPVTRTFVVTGGGGSNLGNADLTQTDPTRTFTIGTNSLTFNATGTSGAVIDTVKIHISPDGHEITAHDNDGYSAGLVMNSQVAGITSLDPDGNTAQITINSSLGQAFIQSVDPDGNTKQIFMDAQSSFNQGIEVRDDSHVGLIGHEVFPISDPKQYAQYGIVDSLIAAAGSTFNFTNGLNQDGADVRLGGTLTAPTSIDVSNHFLAFTSDGVANGSILEHNINDFGVTTTAIDTATRNRFISTITGETVAMGLVNLDNINRGLGFNIDSAKGFQLLDDRFKQGIKYTHFTNWLSLKDSSLVPRKYAITLMDSVKATISSGGVTSVSGTTNRIASTGGTTPVIDISSTFEGLLAKLAANNIFAGNNTFSSSLTLNGGANFAGNAANFTNAGNVGGISAGTLTAGRSYLLPDKNGTFAMTSDIVNQTITLSGDISGSGTTAITTTIGAAKVTNAMLAGSIAASKLVGTDITTVGTLSAGSIPYSLLTGTPTALPPSGTAGGELAGTYPTPTLLNSAVIGKVLTGYSSSAGTVASTDNILQAIQKLNGNDGLKLAISDTAAMLGLMVHKATTETITGAKTATALFTGLRTGLGTTTVNEFALTNTTAAALGAQQITPSLLFSSRGWSTTNSADRDVSFRMYSLPVQGAANPTGLLHIQSSVNAGAFADVFTVSTAGDVVSLGNIGNGGGTIFASGLFKGIGVTGQPGSTFAIGTALAFAAPGTAINANPGTYTGSSGTYNSASITQTYNETSTAGDRDFLINRTETALGSGTHQFMSLQVAGSEKFAISNTNLFSFAGTPGTAGQMPIVNPTGTAMTWVTAYTGLITGTPTIAAGAGAGTSPTVSVTTNGKQLQVTVTTGTLPTGTNATIATVTLPNALTYTPLPVFSSASAATALLNGASMIYMTSTGTANVTITSGTTALTAATTYVWNISL